MLQQKASLLAITHYFLIVYVLIYAIIDFIRHYFAPSKLFSLPKDHFSQFLPILQSLSLAV